MPDTKDAARQRLEKARDELVDLSHRIHAHPELGYEEELASEWLSDYLDANGFAVTKGAHDIPTAFVARAGSGPLHLAICAEYDCLPGIGHACGHNIIAAIGVVMAVAIPSARAQTPSVEEELLALINTVRGTRPVVMHAGLRDVARKHAEAMATAGSLNHRRAKARIDSATPDRPEEGGPPDHGFTGTWCEVVGWEPGGPDVGVARRFFGDWRETPEDSKCMSNQDMTVAGIGAYERGNRWWATLEMVQDTTPPNGTPAKPTATPRGATLVRTAPPTAGPTDLAESRSTAAGSSELPLREIGVSILGFSVVPILYTVRRRSARRRAARV